MMKKLLRLLYRLVKPVIDPRKVALILKYRKFISDYYNYRRLGGKLSSINIYPCLGDDTNSTGFDAQYLYQSIWAFKQIVKHSPESHHDIGSDIRFAGPLSTLIKVEFVDIRPAKLNIEGFTSKKGSVVDLPYPDSSINSLSCLHVIEHIGLGRYGDPLDPMGSDKAFLELSRVLANKGLCLLSVPIGTPKVEFNAHRVFSVDEVNNLTKELVIVSMAAVDENGRYIEDIEIDRLKELESNCSSSFLGLFAFTKEA